MCGLFGGVGKLSSNRMIALGSMNEERGTDSVGLAYLQNSEIRLAKIAERPCVGLNITLRKEVTEAAISGLFIGHTRTATQGTVNSRNAHPFLDDGIVFAHNGIIINDDAFGKYEVDSESLIHGIKAKDFSKYEGPIALIWIEEGKLKAYRCGNPLARGRYNGGTYLASDSDHLKEIGCTHVKELSEGMIYTFNNSLEVKTQRVPKNKTHGTSYIGTGKGYHNDIYTGVGWQDYLEEKWGRKPSPSLSTSLIVKAEEIKEDFRTPSDIAKTLTGTGVDYCDCCGTQAELSEGYCLDCLTWLKDQGIDKDMPPFQLKAVK
jgi:hypothetical protein